TLSLSIPFFFFFFQAEDGIRDPLVTGVQTCALPISARPTASASPSRSRTCRSCPCTFRRTSAAPRSGTWSSAVRRSGISASPPEIGRASCRERGEGGGGGGGVAGRTGRRRRVRGGGE